MSARFEVRVEERCLRLTVRGKLGVHSTYSVVGDSTAFYVHYSTSQMERRQSGWVRGHASVHRGLRRALGGADKLSFARACDLVIKGHPSGSR
jgi:hypothetical protein